MRYRRGKRALCILSIIFLVSCSDSKGADSRIQSVSEEAGIPFGLALPVPHASSTVAIGTLMLCRKGPAASLKIEEVDFQDGGDQIEIASFGTRPAGMTSLGAEVATSLEALGFSERTVSQACGTGEDWFPTELALLVRAKNTPRASAKTMQIHYRTSEDLLVTRVPFSLTICVATAKCEP